MYIVRISRMSIAETMMKQAYSHVLVVDRVT